MGGKEGPERGITLFCQGRSVAGGGFKLHFWGGSSFLGGKEGKFERTSGSRAFVGVPYW